MYEKLTRLRRIAAHVLHQHIEALELLLVADLRDELHFQLAVVQPAGKIEYVHFEQRLDSVHGGAEPQARHRVAGEITVNAAYAHRVYPGERQLVAPHADIRRREPQPAAEFLAGDHAPTHRIGAT